MNQIQDKVQFQITDSYIVRSYVIFFFLNSILFEIMMSDSGLKKNRSLSLHINQYVYLVGGFNPSEKYERQLG